MTHRCQQLMQRCGVMPAEQATLRNQRVPSLLAIASNLAGHLTGAGSLLWGHCPHGPWRDYAHLAMGCVDVAARGQSLGTRLAAALIQEAGQMKNTVGVTAACATDNPASARLLRACGLQPDTERVCAMFTLDGTRKTR
jgi:ribosomal protein S18 acetylase RimI-like enzyme